MRKVVDTGAVRSPKALKFVSASKANELIFTDYLCMECLKGANPEKNFVNSVSGLKSHADQIVILKPTREIIKLQKSLSGLQRRFIDKEHTNSFRLFLKNWDATKTLDPQTQGLLQARGQLASTFFDSLLANKSTVVFGVKRLTKLLGPDDLKTLKKDHVIDENILGLVIKTALDVFLELTKLHPEGAFEKSGNCRDKFLFRYDLACFLMIVWWMMHGGIESVREDRLRNDSIDMTFVAYASYFDGLISLDKKLNSIFRSHETCLNLLAGSS